MNAGDPAGVPPAPDTDILGTPRPQGDRVDMGAHEWMSTLAIVAQPIGGIRQAGQSHTFTVVATGGVGPLHYQWRKDEAVITDAPDDTSYTIADLDYIDAGWYSVVISDYVESAVSEPAQLRVVESLFTSGLFVMGLAAGLLLWCGIRRARQQGPER